MIELGIFCLAASLGSFGVQDESPTLLQASQLIQNERYEEAVALLQRIRDAGPNPGDADRLLGQSLFDNESV